MTPDTAAALVNSMVYKPEWHFDAEVFTKRYESAIRVNVTYAARNSDKEEAPEYATWIEGGARASFTLMVGQDDPLSLVRKLITDVIMPIELHEAREFLRFPTSLNAPYHPHNLDTMAAWGDVHGDLGFGLA